LRPRLTDFGALFSEGVEEHGLLPPQQALKQRRCEAFRETAVLRTKRSFKAAMRLLKPRGLAHLPSMLDLMVREKLVRPKQLPDPRAGRRYAEGLAGLATDLAPETMMRAYSSGLSPSACLGPVAWHSREQRFVALPSDVARQVRAHRRPGEPEWTVAFDRNPEIILAASGRAANCQAVMPERLLRAFGDLFDAGSAHTFEVRDHFDRVVGGGFGVAVGRVFIIEGAFEIVVGAGRVGLVALMGRLRDWNFTLVERAASASWLGGDAFFEISLDDYLDHVKQYFGGPKQSTSSAVSAPGPLPRATWRHPAAARAA
jgi:leucyl/phenylalanyl-tRNA---protein transferase